jgi:hypothetical protein
MPDTPKPIPTPPQTSFIRFMQKNCQRCRAADPDLCGIHPPITCPHLTTLFMAIFHRNQLPLLVYRAITGRQTVPTHETEWWLPPRCHMFDYRGGRGRKAPPKCPYATGKRPVL